MGDLPEFYENKKVKAKTHHNCTSCGEVIKKGDSYLSIKGVWGGKWESFKQCENCEKVTNSFRLMDKDLDYENAPTLELGGVAVWLKEFLCEGWNGEEAANEMAELFSVPISYIRKQIGINS